MQVETTVSPQQPVSWLLELPKPALQLVLQRLDQCSLACSAVTCSTLSQVCPSHLRKVSLTTSHPVGWLRCHSSSMAHVTQCSIDGQYSSSTKMSRLPVPCPQLRQLQLRDVGVQLGRTDGYPGVLHDCTGLTGLGLQDCWVLEVPAAAAALAALPGLQSLTLDTNLAVGDVCLLAELSKLSQLTYLSIRGYGVKPASLDQLSALVNLQDLTLRAWYMHPDGLLGGMPSQLTKLTSLDIHYPQSCTEHNPTEQLQHLSGLTALQRLWIGSNCLATGDLSGLQYLSQLTSLQLRRHSSDLILSTTSVSSWACQAVLQNLALVGCNLRPEALLCFTNLRALRLTRVKIFGDASLEELLEAVSQLSLLTELRFTPSEATHPAAAAFTALTASTNLCSLHLCLWDEAAPWDYVLFRKGTVYPHLRLLDLYHERGTNRNVLGAWPQSDAQLEQLCSCCPALQSLEFVARPRVPPAALLPLLQLSALTKLVVLGGGVAAATAAVGIAAQLTGLRYLSIEYLPPLHHPALLQLTALTGLEELVLRMDPSEHRSGQPSTHMSKLVLQNKARWFDPPDVWIQLLRHFLQDAACRQALLKCSIAPAAAPAQLMLAQLGKELAANSSASVHDLAADLEAVL